MNKMNRRTREILSRPYARVLIPDEDGTYTAEILEFPGCYAEGDTAEDAIKDLEQAAASWIEAAFQQHQEIPEPLDAYGYSGRINLRLPKSIHKQAARLAQKDGVSLNQYFTSAIAAQVGAEQFCERLIQRCQALPPSAVQIIQYSWTQNAMLAVETSGRPSSDRSLENSPALAIEAKGVAANV